MGGRCSKGSSNPTHLQLSDFSIYRSIGRGSFGRVCIVQHRSTKKHYALKYMDKYRCVKQMAAGSVLRELDLLAHISHPFIVNLWFTFQDNRYMYMVSDLLLGGDLRYHLNQQGRFSEDRAKLYICEIALALDYLHRELIVHRDVKPDNILLDDQGHAHLTDFNLATRLGPNTLATSFSGTRPYMAPEILMCSLGYMAGYDHRVDWFSLGVCFYEMLMGRRPFEYTAKFTSQQVKHLRKTAPVFVPRSDSLNCDPTHELEMRIFGSSTLGGSRTTQTLSKEELEIAVEEITRAFTAYNRQVQSLPQRQMKVMEEETSFTTACESNCYKNAV